VRKVYIVAFACAIVLDGCHSTERSGTCAPIGGATRVVVQGSWQGTIPGPQYVITDPKRIHRLIAFANLRREGSRPSLSTMPAPQVNAAFYDEANFLGAIGAGSNFFFVSCPNWKGVRIATDVELADFKGLIGSQN